MTTGPLLIVTKIWFLPELPFNALCLKTVYTRIVEFLSYLFNAHACVCAYVRVRICACACVRRRVCAYALLNNIIYNNIILFNIKEKERKRKKEKRKRKEKENKSNPHHSSKTSKNHRNQIRLHHPQKEEREKNLPTKFFSSQILFPPNSFPRENLFSKERKTTETYLKTQ